MGLSNMTNNTHQIHKFHKKLKQEMFIFQNKVFKVGGLTREEGGGEARVGITIFSSIPPKLCLLG